MMTKEEYEKEIVRMWDNLRDEHKGEHACSGVKCEDCPLYYYVSVCHSYGAVNAYEVYEKTIKCINYVERWSKEHPPKKYKVSKAEYDILQEVYSIHGNFRMYQNEIINNLREKGYFKGSHEDTEIDYYLKNCEVADDD